MHLPASFVLVLDSTGLGHRTRTRGSNSLTCCELLVGSSPTRLTTPHASNSNEIQAGAEKQASSQSAKAALPAFVSRGKRTEHGQWERARRLPPQSAIVGRGISVESGSPEKALFPPRPHGANGKQPGPVEKGPLFFRDHPLPGRRFADGALANRGGLFR